MFEYANVRIRPIEEDDLGQMAKLRADPSVWMNLGSIEMISLCQEKSWYERMLTNPKIAYYVLYSAEIDFLGIVRTDEIDYINRSIRVGGDLLAEHRGQGYGACMFELLKKYCFDYLNMNRVWLLVLETNETASRLYRKAGFINEGCQRQAIYREGRYVGYVMMSMLKAEYVC